MTAGCPPAAALIDTLSRRNSSSAVRVVLAARVSYCSARSEAILSTCASSYRPLSRNCRSTTVYTGRAVASASTCRRMPSSNRAIFSSLSASFCPASFAVSAPIERRTEGARVSNTFGSRLRSAATETFISPPSSSAAINSSGAPASASSSSVRVPPCSSSTMLSAFM